MNREYRELIREIIGYLYAVSESKYNLSKMAEAYANELVLMLDEDRERSDRHETTT